MFNIQLKNVFFFKKINILHWLFFLFWIILNFNCIGLIPETVALNSIFLVTIFLSFWMSFTYNFYGISLKKEQWFDLFLPKNIPLWITPLLIILEIISYFARVISLAIRLFANMLAGHTLLKILASFTLTFLLQFNFLVILFWLPLGIVLGVTVLETLIAFLQSYVFLTLICIYLNDVINLH